MKKVKTKSKKLLSALLAFALIFGLFAAMPLTASAEDGPFQVTKDPVGATYYLNEDADPLTATFEYDALLGFGSLHSQSPITVRWYWSYEDSNTDRDNGSEESNVGYSRVIKHTTTHVPATDEIGVKYYYAVISYTESVMIVTAQSEQIPRETVTKPARIEVIDPGEPEEESFTVKKTDGNGAPLAGATLRLEGLTEDEIPRVYDVVTGSDGIATFVAENGNYTLSEHAAPNGFNATDETYEIVITPNGVYIRDVPGRLTPYTQVTFVNKKIPALNSDDHFAYMQGYPEGDFRPGGNMTRAEAVVMFSRLMEESMNLTVDYRYACYPDVDHTNPSMLLPWYANPVCFMHLEGVLADYSRDVRFRPNDPVTRAEFATLASHFDNLTLTDDNVFSDVSSGHWAVKYINSSAAKGWIAGYPDGTFRPEANITRAEVVTLVNRILKRKADRDYIPANISKLPRSYSDLKSTYWAYWDIMEASIGHDYEEQGDGEKWTKVYE